MEITPLHFIIGAVVFLVIFTIYIYLKKRRQQMAITAHDIIRELKINLGKTKERFDSRTQWTFQKKGEYNIINVLKKQLSDLEKKGDWELGGMLWSKQKEFDEIREILEHWAKVNPNYFTKNKYFKELEHISDILERWGHGLKRGKVGKE